MRGLSTITWICKLDYETQKWGSRGPKCQKHTTAHAMKCIYIGFSLSKLQSFFWKISLNSCLIRLEGFNNKNSRNLRVCSTWSSGKAFARCTEGPEFEFGQYLFLFASFLFFFFFFFFSFSFHFRYNSFVMFLYIAHNFWLTNFLLRFTCHFPQVLREVLRFTYF